MRCGRNRSALHRELQNPHTRACRECAIRCYEANPLALNVRNSKYLHTVRGIYIIYYIYTHILCYYVYIYTYIYMYICIYVYMYIYIYIHVYIYICMHACMHACMHVCVCACVYVCVCVWVYTCVCVYVHVYVLVYRCWYGYRYVKRFLVLPAPARKLHPPPPSPKKDTLAFSPWCPTCIPAALAASVMCPKRQGWKSVGPEQTVKMI